jgi:hypothetical protein
VQATTTKLYVAAMALLALLLVGLSETAVPFAGAHDVTCDVCVDCMLC